jgi:hypothetical protein
MARLVAKGIHTHPYFKLGAIIGPEARDDRTIDLMKFLDTTTFDVPAKWDFDKKRKPFAQHMWGNNVYGDCEVAARANYINRIQRREASRTATFTDDDVITLYKEMTGCEIPGDNNDSGMTTLDNLKQWRTGWSPPSLAESHPDHVYNIDAYGYVDAGNNELLRQSMYLFNGILLGIDLPYTAAEQTEAGEPWDFVPDAGWKSEPGSWGGHCVLTKRYDDGSIYVLTWATEIRVTDAFVKNYVVEAYAAIESFKKWTSYRHIFDTNALITEMQQLGIEVES